MRALCPSVSRLLSQFHLSSVRRLYTVFSWKKGMCGFELLGAAQNLPKRLSVSANHTSICSHLGWRLTQASFGSGQRLGWTYEIVEDSKEWAFSRKPVLFLWFLHSAKSVLCQAYPWPFPQDGVSKCTAVVLSQASVASAASQLPAQTTHNLFLFSSACLCCYIANSFEYRTLRSLKLA